ncbi:bacterio-opsin activator HTH domain-containing protein [Halovivax asiaticus JCM 14624]|uniref:Bacterio-opsin activator HTH domain-containing protein n=1 Tax=Halovivax asiaticus JCM 14624 TaxID=1227490 RepID=M0BH35_9EURY|nr:bacterio-opsin activator domain-containing protein [Halovivax asiaticus]ELZ08959.1 bacterio-opsin activator HTH domain-containing protein [Halovivax asiaticus JCM 14624]
MSIFGKFHVPSSAFALHETLTAVPDLAIEIERVVVTDEVLTPYFWISGVSPSAFETAARGDPTIQHIKKLDEFADSALYRAEWTAQVQSVLYAYTEIDAVILEATGTDQRWELRIRFDDRDQLGAFQDYCERHRIAFSLQQLTQLSQPKTGGQYGLTPKQQEALVAAWEAGYFETPKEAALTDVADELDITQQSLSKRLQRANQALIGNTLVVSAEYAAPDAPDPDLKH